MSSEILAIANCRVSSIEQLENNSLNRQQNSVYAAAEHLGAEIVQLWSGSVSSKAGTNVNRKDLREMLEICKKNKKIKYAIFDEYDRFMRSVNEGAYFEVEFEMLGVKVWYASHDDTFNGNNAMAKFMRSMSAYTAEGSNEERQKKSISGQTSAMKAGRYPFSPKPGYMRGTTAGVPLIHPVRGPALQEVLLRVVRREVTPTEGLIELNRSDYTLDRALIKMDKFRKIATDPFYAGIIQINKQVNVRNENGIHDPLITLEQHGELVAIFTAKKKNQSGPRKNGNPKYPLSKIVSHDKCIGLKNKGKFVGFDHSNGKNKKLIYEKYRCRSCGFLITREDLHNKIIKLFENNRLSQEAIKDFVDAIEIVWKDKEIQSMQDSSRISKKMNALKIDIDSRISAAIDPSNVSIKPEIIAKIETMKVQLDDMAQELLSLTKKLDTDKELFITFALTYMSNMGENFLSISQENRDKCKQIIFPSGFYIDDNKNVYTPEISTLIRLATKKKDTEVSEKSHLVRVQGL